jgi:hypothetical protein
VSEEDKDLIKNDNTDGNDDSEKEKTLIEFERKNIKEEDVTDKNVREEELKQKIE